MMETVQSHDYMEWVKPVKFSRTANSKSLTIAAILIYVSHWYVGNAQFQYMC